MRIERNMYELLLDKLFNLRAEVEISGRKLYLRALSDIDIEIRDRAALLASRQARKSLSDLNSATYQEKLGYIDDLSQKDLTELLVALETANQARSAVRWLHPDHIPMPEGDEATLESRSVVIDKRADELKATEIARQKLVDDNIVVYRQGLEGKARDDLIEECRRVMGEYQINIVYAKEANDQTVLLGTYEDAIFKKRVFKNTDEIRSLPRALKDALRIVFDELDSADIWALKD